MQIFFILILCLVICQSVVHSLVEWQRKSKKCPSKYLKFTPQHTFCLSPSQSCHLLSTGVSEEDKEIILDLHNRFRSKTAMGHEDRARDGTLPQAADMMQMEWDSELAAIAQKWTQNCQWRHDCTECRAVENFAVGQNLAIKNLSCSGYGCSFPDHEPDWAWAIKLLYDEVKDYYASWLRSFIGHPGPKTGHFTQIIWSRSWRVGCGYTLYKEGKKFHKYYACNYGPAGNVKGKFVYKQGRPCSACPTNSKCSTSRRGPNTYPGLCKMRKSHEAPNYPRNKKGQLFYCGASVMDPDCQGQVSGDGRFQNVNSVGGNYKSLVLRGGQSATIAFIKPVKPRGGGFCVSLNFRKGPLDALERDVSSFKTNFTMGRSFSPPSEIKPQSSSFSEFNIIIPWNKKTKLGFTFSVPRGSGLHALDIRKIEAFDGSCSSRKD